MIRSDRMGEIIINGEFFGSDPLLRTQVSELTESINEISNVSGIRWHEGYISKSGTLQPPPAPTRRYSSKIPCGSGVRLLYMGETNHKNVSALTCYNESNIALQKNVNVGDMDTEYETITPEGTSYVRISASVAHEAYVRIYDDTNVMASAIFELQKKWDGEKEKALRGCYVSKDGSDANDGSIGSPFATVTKAIDEGFTDIMISGGVYEEVISPKSMNVEGKKISISNYTKDRKVVFADPDRIISSSETKVSEYNKVYKVITDKTFNQNNKWIYQDGVNDVTTLIQDEERHPLERGMEYRCEDTKIEVCTSTDVVSALSEIDSSDEYKWFYDSGNKTLYFSRPQPLTTDKPLCMGSGKNLLNNMASRNISLKMYGIECKYLCMNVNQMYGVELVDCKASNVFGAGAFTYDGALSVRFTRCEAVRCQSGIHGDGFNGHSSSTGDIYSKQTTIILEDCWSHDNQDDGYSDHERSETTIIGGLYEYNGKGGVTPSYGSHCTCNGAYSRKNGSGFYYTGSVAQEEGGKHGQMICYNCVAEENMRGGAMTGFKVDGAGNSAILVECKSIGNNYGFATGTGSHITLIDCGALNNTYVTTGNITTKNTNLVTE